MTVTYTAEVATCAKFGCFIKLLGRWRGSIYKLIWMDLILFLTLYYCINLIYIHILEDDSKRTFESIVYYCASYTSLIPLSFVLGFYVNLVMTRWWEQYITIPWPDSIAVFVSAHVHGQDEGSRVMRRTVMRYVCLCLTIVFTMISPCVKKRFPKMKNLVDAGLLLENEKKIIESMDSSFPKYPKHWMPIVWAASIITRARKEGRIRDDFAVKTIIDELNSFRGLCGTLMYYDFISIPLVYTQVVTIAVYSFFVCSLLAHQWTDNKRNTYEALDFYSPVFITLQFFFYMGWLKVAETLINPFGEDDDDFEVNWMIDRNLQMSYLIVDEMHHEHPELIKDQYWDEVYPNELPYESDAKREQPPEPSTAKYDLEDSPKRAISKVTSPTNSVVMNGKTGTSIQSAFNQRSQRFNEAFQRLFNFSEEDTSSIRPDVENSFQSVSDIENLEHITSYTHSDQIEFESQMENENIWMRSVLEPVTEVNQDIYEIIEEEMESIKEEDDQIKSESYESDSDSDPFERLRIERQKLRLQRMNDYLERYFGPKFRIVTENLPTTESKSKYKKPETLDQENKETFNKLEINDENLLTPTISVHYEKAETALTPTERNKEISEIYLENNEKLLTPKVSNMWSIQDSTLKSISNDENMLCEGTFISLEDNDKLQDANLSIINVLIDSLVLTGNNLPIMQKEESNAEIQKVIFPEVSLPSIQTTSLRQDSQIFIAQDLASTSEIVTQKSILLSQVQSCTNNLPTSFKLTEPSQTVEPLSSIEQTPLYSSESELFLKSKATSPLGSARSVSTQSSLVDDWEILSTGNASVTAGYTVDIEKSENKHDDKNE